MEISSDKRLEQLKTLLIAGAPLSIDLRFWLISGIESFQKGKCKELCSSLGLRKQGLSSFATRAKINNRNSTIKEIAKQYEGEDWQKAVIIAKNINRYPYIKEKALYSVLFGIKEVKIPKTTQGIHNIIKK